MNGAKLTPEVWGATTQQIGRPLDDWTRKLDNSAEPRSQYRLSSSFARAHSRNTLEARDIVELKKWSRYEFIFSMHVILSLSVSLGVIRVSLCPKGEFVVNICSLLLSTNDRVKDDDPGFRLRGLLRTLARRQAKVQTCRCSSPLMNKPSIKATSPLSRCRRDQALSPWFPYEWTLLTSGGRISKFNIKEPSSVNLIGDGLERGHWPGSRNLNKWSSRTLIEFIEIYGRYVWLIGSIWAPLRSRQLRDQWHSRWKVPQFNWGNHITKTIIIIKICSWSLTSHLNKIINDHYVQTLECPISNHNLGDWRHTQTHTNFEDNCHYVDDACLFYYAIGRAMLH